MNKKIVVYYGDSLQHHGILGQKWGKRNGPPYPLGSGDHSAREEKAGWEKSLDSKKSFSNKKPNAKETVKIKRNKKQEVTDNTGTADSKTKSKIESPNNKKESLDKSIKSRFHISEKQLEQYKKAAKILGVSLAATAGVLAAAYYVNKYNPDAISKITNFISNKIGSTSVNSNVVNRLSLLGKDFVNVHQIEGTYNATADLATTLTIDELNKVTEDSFEYSVTGRLARAHGYGRVKSGNALFNALRWTDSTSLCEDVICNQRYNDFFTGMDRRLSCWSGSHAYLVSMITGRQYCSKNYQSLVEFNDFGKLYTRNQKIIDLFGNAKTDFVGKFGTNSGTRSRPSDAYKMVDTIFKNFKNPNAIDGSVVGFIDAAYRDTTCTHQWNFRIKDGVLSMIDGWSGREYDVARQLSNGKIQYNLINMFKDNGLGNNLFKELQHYNRESFRMYSPSFGDINFDAVADVILAKLS